MALVPIVVPPRPAGMRRRALAPPVRRMIADLAQRHGKSFASEAGFRRELFRTTGYVCGVRSIGRVIHRLVGCGEVGHERVKPNGAFASGQTTNSGGQQNWIIVRRAQRKARRRAREEERQTKHQAARQERERLELEQRRRERAARDRAARAESAEAAISLRSVLAGYKPAELAPIVVAARAELAPELEEKRRAEVERARELAARWDEEDKRGRPPDE